MRIILLSLALLTAPTPVCADPLVLVAADPESWVVVDSDNMLWTAKESVKLWEITRYTPPQFRLKGELISMTKVQREVLCQTRQTRRLYGFAIGKSGNWFDQGAFRDPLRPIPPGSHLETIYKVACEGIHDGGVMLTDIDHLIRTQDDASK